MSVEKYEVILPLDGSLPSPSVKICLDGETMLKTAILNGIHEISGVKVKKVDP